MIQRWKRDHTNEKCKEKTDDRVVKMKRLSLRCLGKGETLFCREKSGRNKEKNVSNMVAQTNHQITNYVVENKLTW